MLAHYPSGSLNHIRAYELALDMADREAEQIAEIEQDFQAALPKLIEQAKSELDDDDFAEFINNEYFQRDWFIGEHRNSYDSELLESWIAQFC